jgi:hypothetical protein
MMTTYQSWGMKMKLDFIIQQTKSSLALVFSKYQAILNIPTGKPKKWNGLKIKPVQFAEILFLNAFNII